MKKKKKKPTKSRVDVRTIVITAIVDFLVGPVSYTHLTLPTILLV